MAGQPGTYLLLLRLDAATELGVGRLGRFEFLAGWYLYAGSALGGLDARLRRHARRVKPRHWHVDALREVADLELVAIRVGRERLECAAAARVAALPGARIAAAGFGASDCRCPGHLTYFERPPDPRLDSEWTISTRWGSSCAIRSTVTYRIEPGALPGW
jgi:Uri superfamily endonuclease